ncbi:MAG: hypothetical protein V2A58_13970 [Planctomycetota bacterium]
MGRAMLAGLIIAVLAVLPAIPGEPAPYDIRALLPGIKPYVEGAPIVFERSGIVKEVIFTNSAPVVFDRSGIPKGAIPTLTRDSRTVTGRILLRNDGQDRVKPDVRLFILNKDGVVLDRYVDEWLVSSLSPEEEYRAEFTLLLRMPDDFAFSRWASEGWDERPVWVFAAGSTYTWEKLREKAAEGRSR